MNYDQFLGYGGGGILWNGRDMDGSILQIRYLKKAFLQDEWNEIFYEKKPVIIFILRNN